MRISWIRGGEATILKLEGERISLRSTIPAAPGTPLEGQLDDGRAIKIKVARCRRDEPDFLIDGRLLDTTREVRLAIEHALALLAQMDRRAD